MSGKAMFTVRPFSRPARSDLKDALRINLSATVLLSLKAKSGDICLLQRDGLDEQPAIAWQAAEKLHDTVVQVSKPMQDICDLKLGDKVLIRKSEAAVRDAVTVWLRESSDDDDVDSPPQDQILDADKSHWEWLLHDPLSRTESLMAGLRLEPIRARGQKRRFTISQVDGAGLDVGRVIYKHVPTTTVSIVSPSDGPITDRSRSNVGCPRLLPTHIGGLRRPLEQINLLLRRFDAAFQDLTRPFNYRPTQGLLLYGPKGTGKSLVIDQMSLGSWVNVIRWSAMASRGKDVGERLANSFEEAIRQQPCLMIIEQFKALASKRSSLEDIADVGVLSGFRKGFELIRNHDVLVVAETRHPNDIDDSLRAQTRFGIEVELPVPAMDGRLEILRCIRGDVDQPPNEILKNLAERTHGYVGADLFALYQRIIELAAHRALASHESVEEGLSGLAMNGSSTLPAHIPSSTSSVAPLVVHPDDTIVALNTIRPSAMQEVFLETPNVQWQDIGGHASTKKHLQRSISRPLRHSDTMSRLNLRSSRGMLLYGPPGCSKTLLVKSLATESGLNFLAVKGAELVSMYVGESERAVREIFNKARAASPSIIFFDEFDSIASSRGGSSSSSASSGSNMNVVTTLLNELDGFEALRNVLVVAATNRPDVLDPALLRPGRMDNLIYVGPPDLEARIEILNLWLAKSQVDWDGQGDEQGGGVDVPNLAQVLDGCSGAEVVNVCEKAGELAMNEEEEAEETQHEADASVTGQKTPEEKKKTRELEVKIRMAHLVTAAATVDKAITSDVVRAYEQWSVGRGLSW